MKKIIGLYLNIVCLILPNLGGKLAFYIFCIPFKAKIKPLQQEFLDTGNPTKLEVDGIQVAAYTWGQGPKNLVLIHGWQSNTYRWKKYIENLDLKEFTIHSFDAPGHGNSGSTIGNVPLYEKTLLKLSEKIGPIDTILAHSIGSFSGQYFLHKNKIQVNKFISLASPYCVEEFIKFYKSELSLSSATIKSFSKQFVKYAGEPIEYFSLETFAPGLPLQTLIIHDKQDRDTSFENAVKLHSFLPNSILDITEGFGHKLKDESILKKVKEFAERH